MFFGSSRNISSILLPLIKSSITSSLLVCSIQYSTNESLSINESTYIASSSSSSNNLLATSFRLAELL
ncbi:hypothetical protein [Clostridium celatum]|uniref:hypothetical protein n=1 Tax=Clostridium celatum TaxID=36834 RepID=UPI001FACED26|nr:hypothetical protein [Clostridium celatum]